MKQDKIETEKNNMTQEEKTMTITEQEVYEDYKRFLRHEAMRANCKQTEILKIINDGEISNS